MKGVGTFRRALSAATALLGMSSTSRALDVTRVIGRVDVPTLREDRGKKQRRRKYRANKRTAPRKGWPLIYWGDCPKPVSRKVLKRIASNWVPK
jgi:hypothetical protein